MSARLLLQSDWKDYDNRKLRERKSALIFCCGQEWEKKYLASKIKHIYPEETEERIHEAIEQCCKETSAYAILYEFVEEVMKKLACK